MACCNFWSTPTCRCCGTTTETQEHLFSCPHPKLQESYTVSTTSFTNTLHTMETNPFLFDPLLRLFYWSPTAPLNTAHPDPTLSIASTSSNTSVGTSPAPVCLPQSGPHYNKPTTTLFTHTVLLSNGRHISPPLFGKLTFLPRPLVPALSTTNGQTATQHPNISPSTHKLPPF